MLLQLSLLCSYVKNVNQSYIIKFVSGGLSFFRDMFSPSLACQDNSFQPMGHIILLDGSWKYLLSSSAHLLLLFRCMLREGAKDGNSVVGSVLFSSGRFRHCGTSSSCHMTVVSHDLLPFAYNLAGGPMLPLWLKRAGFGKVDEDHCAKDLWRPAEGLRAYYMSPNQFM